MVQLDEKTGYEPFYQIASVQRFNLPCGLLGKRKNWLSRLFITRQKDAYRVTSKTSDNLTQNYSEIQSLLGEHGKRAETTSSGWLEASLGQFHRPIEVHFDLVEAV
jgi:hypothetical protein